MTQFPIPKERLEKIASWRETYGAGHNVMLPAEEAEALARFALAAYEQEPVATLDVQSGREDGKTFALAYSSAAHKLPDDVYFLYTHPAPELSAIVDRLNLSGYEHEDGEVTPQNAAAVVDILLQQLDESVQGRDTHPAPVPAVPDYYVVVTTANVWQTFCKTRAEADFIVSKPFHKGYYVLEVYTRRAAMLNGGKS